MTIRTLALAFAFALVSGCATSRGIALDDAVYVSAVSLHRSTADTEARAHTGEAQRTTLEDPSTRNPPTQPRRD